MAAEAKMTSETAKGLGCLALLGVIGVLWIGSMVDDPKPEFIRMSTADHFAVIITPQAKPAAVEAAAREKCGEQQFCKVLGWTDRDLAARALPMLDREVAALVFAYTLNRSTGLEQVQWDCGTWPQADKARCLSE